jgi:hypothetical protein
MDTSFKVGDKVFSYARQEWGTVKNIDTTHYPVKVYFLSGNLENYTKSGTYQITDKAPDLFFDEVSIDPPLRPVTNLAIDTKVLVREDGATHRRYFSHFSDGEIYCFNNGQTSWTASGASSWPYWELADK